MHSARIAIENNPSFPNNDLFEFLNGILNVYGSLLKVFGRFVVRFGILISFPFWYPIIFLILRRFINTFKKWLKSVRKLEVSAENFSHLKEFHKSMVESKSNILDDRFEMILKSASRWPLRVFRGQLMKISDVIVALIDTIESKLYPDNKDQVIPQEEIDKVKAQLSEFIHDWDDDEFWGEFESTHNHHSLN
ncbi:MAG: hypothetical protein V2B15_03615 [Bacteroidota bacterium]